MRVSTATVLKITILSGVISLFVFLMIQVLMAQILLDSIITMVANQNQLVILIILIGFLVAMFVSIFTGLIVSEEIEKKFVLASSLLAMLANLIFWIVLSYTTVAIKYPEYIENLTIWERVISFPSVFGYYAVIEITNITWLWIYSLISYTLLLGVFLKALGDSSVVRTKYGYEKYQRMWK